MFWRERATADRGMCLAGNLLKLSFQVFLNGNLHSRSMIDDDSFLLLDGAYLVGPLATANLPPAA